MRRMIFLGLCGALSAAHAAYFAARGGPQISHAHRAPCAAMCSPILPSPPAPPPTSEDHGYGGGDGDSLLLTDVHAEQRTALLSLWSFQYEVDAEGDETDRDLRAARFMHRWKGDQHKSGWFRCLKGRSLGVFLGEALKSPEALVLVRYELDRSWQRAICGKHVLVVDEVLLAPSVPPHVRGTLHAAIVQTLLLMGSFHAMSVLWEENQVAQQQQGGGGFDI